MKYCIVIFTLLICCKSFSQGLTAKDFKLFVDDFMPPHPDSALVLTTQQLQKIKKLRTNFSWATIKSFKVYFSSCTAFCTSWCSCDGDVICAELMKYFERAGNGTVIFIEPYVNNKKGQRIEWSGLSIKIKQP